MIGKGVSASIGKWGRRIDVNDSDPALTLVQRGSGTALTINDGTTDTLTIGKDGTLSGLAIALQDDEFLKFGNTAAAPNVQIGWETADPNANELVVDLPTGGAVDVPVIAVGVGVLNVNLGFFNGLTEPMVAVLDVTRVSYVGLHANAAAGPTLRMKVGAGAVRSHTIPDVVSDTFAMLAATQSLSAKTLVSPVITTSPTAAGSTWADLGIVTTVDINGGTLDGATIGGAVAGAITGTIITVNTSLLPDADGGAVLGGATVGFSSLFLDVGAVINFNNSDVTLTHAATTLTVSSGLVNLIALAPGSVVVNEGAADVDVRIEADTNANLAVFDAGLFGGVGGVAIGGAIQATPTAFVLIDPTALTVTANQNFSRLYLRNGGAITVAVATTSAVVASVSIDEPNITATGTVTDTAVLYITGVATEAANSHNWGIWQAAGKALIGAVTAGAWGTGVTTGLLINQGAADDSILEGKSSDVAHGITTIAETDTYAQVLKYSATAGGVNLRGFSDTTTGIGLTGIHVTDETVKSTAAVGAIRIRGYVKSGTDVAALGANANIMTIANADTTQWLVDAEGDVWQTGSITLGGGDATIDMGVYLNSSGTDWYVAIDNSTAGDPLYFGTGATAGSASRMVLGLNNDVLTINNSYGDITGVGAGGAAGLKVTPTAILGSVGTDLFRAVYAQPLIGATSTANWTATIGIVSSRVLMADFGTTANVYTVTGVVGVYITDVSNKGSAVVTHSDGIYVGPVTSGGTNNSQLTLETGTPTVAARADLVQTFAYDIAAGDARLGVLSEAGSAIYVGNDRLRFAAATGGISIGATDILTSTTTLVTLPVSTLASAGVKIGADSTNNLIDDASNGAGSTTLYIGNASITVVPSDRRLKDNITPLVGWDVSGWLRGAYGQLREFDWRKGNQHYGQGRQLGFVAQDFEKFDPRYVIQPPDAESMYGFEYDKVTPVLIAGWNDHDRRIEALESENARLRERIAELEVV